MWNYYWIIEVIIEVIYFLCAVCDFLLFANIAGYGIVIKFYYVSSVSLIVLKNTSMLSLQGVEIFQNVTAGIIMSQNSLVLQNVARSTAGDYTCMATNEEGKGASNIVKLVVRCK